MIALREIECAVVTQTLQMRFNSHSRIIRWPLRAAVKVDIKLNLQTTDILFEAREAILDRGFLIDPEGLVPIASFFGEPGKLVIFSGQMRDSYRVTQAGSPPLISV